MTISINTCILRRRYTPTGSTYEFSCGIFTPHSDKELHVNSKSDCNGFRFGNSHWNFWENHL